MLTDVKMLTDVSDLSIDPIREFQADLQRMADRAERLRPVLRACQDAIARAESTATIQISTRSLHADPHVHIMAVCKQRLDEMVPLFHELAKEGLKTDKQNSHTDNAAFDVLAMREYNLGHNLKVTAMLMPSRDGENGPTCRIKKVGVKEVPVYEIECD